MHLNGFKVPQRGAWQGFFTAPVTGDGQSLVVAHQISNFHVSRQPFPSVALLTLAINSWAYVCLLPGPQHPPFKANAQSGMDVQSLRGSS